MMYFSVSTPTYLSSSSCLPLARHRHLWQPGAAAARILGCACALKSGNEKKSQHKERSARGGERRKFGIVSRCCWNTTTVRGEERELFFYFLTWKTHENAGMLSLRVVVCGKLHRYASALTRHRQVAA